MLTMVRTFQRSLPILVTAGWLVPMVAADAPARWHVSPGLSNQPQVAYETSPDNLIASFHELVPEVAQPATAPMVRVFGDGRIAIRVPHYLQGSGTFETHLSQAELDALLLSLLKLEIVDFEATRVAELQSEIEASRRSLQLAQGRAITLHHVADAPTTLIELHLGGYRPPGAVTFTELHRDIAWRALRSDAERYPDIQALQELLAAERLLRGLMEHDGLRRIRE